MKQLLDGIWKLKCFEPGVSEAKFTIDACVPGNVELDICKAGIEPDPYFSTNEYLYHKYELCDWEYSREVVLPSDDKLELTFEGLNCFADIYLDGKLIGHTENAFIAHTLPIAGFEREKALELKVHIHSAILEARKFDYPVHVAGPEGSDEAARLRMPPHSFGWDIMPRFPSAGLWRSVYIESVPAVRFTQVYYAVPSASELKASVDFKYRFESADACLDGYTVRVYLDDTLYCEKTVHFISGSGEFSVDNPRLWWPRGYGKAELYTAKMQLLKNGEVAAEDIRRIGLRSAEIVHKMAPNDEGEFLIKINGCPILAKGSNWVPMDAFHSRDAARYERAVALFAECGCNIMRMWGGNVYEDHKLFDLCDENGIMVWQDFSMACCIYPQDSDFAHRIEEEASFIVRKLRNHACILLWSGDNEVDEAYNWRGYNPESNRYNALTREVLPRVIRQNDPYRRFLPSSPYIDDGVARYSVPEQHNWGPRAFYKDEFYKNTNAHFISECGYHGCPSPESIRKFIPENELFDIYSPAWTAHNSEYRPLYKRGYNRNQLMADQVRIMCGSIPDELELFALISQFVQAEAKKFFVERARMKKWRRTGIIWWNMIDGWPQISDAIVDWYYVKKRAFNALKRVHVPVCVMLDEVSGWNQSIIISNDSREDALVRYRIYDADTNETISEGERLSPANQALEVGSIRCFASEKRLLMIEWFVNGKRFVNHYLCGFPPYGIEDIKRWAAIIDEADK